MKNLIIYVILILVICGAMFYLGYYVGTVKTTVNVIVEVPRVFF